MGLAVTGESSPTGIFDGADDDGAEQDEADRQAVMSQAQQFILRVNTYGPDLLAEDGTMPAYREQVLEVITDKFAASFEESVPAAESTVSQAGFARTAEVFGAGVSAIDRDSATALVAGSFTNSYPVDAEDLEGERQDDLPLPFRVQHRAGQGRRRVAGRRVLARHRRGRGARHRHPPSEEATP